MQLMIDRRRHCKMIRELSDRYDLILIDRFDLSTVAYQGYGDGIDLDLIQLNDMATEGIVVRRRIWLDIPVGVAVERLRDRGEQLVDGEIARLVQVNRGYSQLYDQGPLWRMKCIQASQSPDAVLRDAIALIEEVL